MSNTGSVAKWLIAPLLTDAAGPNESRRAVVNRPYLIGEDNF